MAHIIVWHQVEDFDQWKSKFDEHASVREASGSRGGTVYRSTDDSKEVVVVLGWDTKENAQAFIASQDLEATMADAGVTGQPMVAFVDDGVATPV